MYLIKRKIHILSPVQQMSSYTDITRLLQFTVALDEESYVCLLNLLEERGINIRASLTLTVDGMVFTKFIVNTLGQPQGLSAVNTTREVLKYLGVDTTEQFVLAVVVLSPPGQLLGIRRLFYKRLSVRASYQDYTFMTVIYEVSNLDLAERLLRNSANELLAPVDCSPCQQQCNKTDLTLHCQRKRVHVEESTCYEESTSTVGCAKKISKRRTKRHH